MVNDTEVSSTFVLVVGKSELDSGSSLADVTFSPAGMA